MATETADITLKPIGVVTNDLKELPRQGADFIISDIFIDENLTDALDYIDEFSALIVFYWIQQGESTEPKPLKVYPQQDETQPQVGIFASDSMDRPNPVGIAIARLLERQGNMLRVFRLPALNGTPIIDIKPYIPRHSNITDVKVASWTEQRGRRP